MVKVLVAEDEAIERMALCARLRQLFGDEIAVIQAGDGEEAVRLYEEEGCQAALLDINMPQMLGTEAAEQIRKGHPEAVIVFLSAYDDFQYARKALQVRALDYLLKPWDKEELAAVVQEAIEQAEKRAGGAKRQAQALGGGRPQEGEGLKAGQVAGAMREYIRANYMKEISMQDAARAMNYSEAYFCKLFKQCFDQNFTTYLTKYRIGEAKKLLMDPGISVKEAGARVGYFDSNYFAKVFKRMTGEIPSEFRGRYFSQK